MTKPGGDTMQTRYKRSDYRQFCPIITRWMDNDAYGHVNNVIYYSWFDTAVNSFLIANNVLDIGQSPAIGFVIETHCNYLAPVVFPDRITIGLRVARLGNSSVRYELGVFREDDEAVSAHGHFVQVYVDRETHRPTPIPDATRTLLQSIQA